MPFGFQTYGKVLRTQNLSFLREYLRAETAHFLVMAPPTDLDPLGDFDQAVDSSTDAKDNFYCCQTGLIRAITELERPDAEHVDVLNFLKTALSGYVSKNDPQSFEYYNPSRHTEFLLVVHVWKNVTYPPPGPHEFRVTTPEMGSTPLRGLDAEFCFVRIDGPKGAGAEYMDCGMDGPLEEFSDLIVCEDKYEYKCQECPDIDHSIQIWKRK